MKTTVTMAALLTAAATALPPPREPAPGEVAFAKCTGCHSLAPGEHANGPSLYAIVGKPIAAVTSYPYSPALRALAEREAVWTPDLLDRFVADPERLAPGTEMGFFLRTDPRERAALIAYLLAAGPTH